MVLVEALNSLRSDGVESCLEVLNRSSCAESARDQRLVNELRSRLRGEPGPRLLVDALWLRRPIGGITRVWEQIMSTWSLPGLITQQAPLQMLDREALSALVSRFETWNLPSLDPLDIEAVAGTSQHNAELASRFGAEVFLSTGISVCGEATPQCRELALVHDCMPERSQISDELKQQRRRWLQGAGAYLAVSRDTAEDLEGLLQCSSGSIPWCHPAPDPCFLNHLSKQFRDQLWRKLRAKFQLSDCFVVVPASSSIGSYKNPELVAKALLQPGLGTLHLLLCGAAAERHGFALEKAFPDLEGRVTTARLTDLELAEVYRRSVAVVMPSRIEGFGLPVVEALAAGGHVLAADSRGLREAALGASPLFSSQDPRELAAWLKLLMDPDSALWLAPHLNRRRMKRLQRLHPDYLGLELLVQARQLSANG